MTKKIDQMISIGALARSSGVHIETIRYYERCGLLDPPQRSAGGHRKYSPAAAARLRFVRRARELGFGLDEVRQLLDISVNSAARDADALAMTRARLKEVRKKIADMQNVERVLCSVIGEFVNRATGGILAALSHGESGRTPVLHDPPSSTNVRKASSSVASMTRRATSGAKPARPSTARSLRR